MIFRTVILSFVILMQSTAGFADETKAPDWAETYKWLRGYIQTDTINPPGNEVNAVKYLGDIFDAEGIEWHSGESAPGRGNIWARLKGGSEPALMLLHHSDVVPADEKYWTTDPLSAEEKDGFLYGRGTLDTKSLGISQLAAFIALKRSGIALNRDVIYLASADEEAGGLFGVGWLIENRPEIFKDVGMILNEGGGAGLENGKIISNIEVSQKVPVWLRLTAIDEPGHGSTPHPTSSVTRIVQAMNRIYENPFPARLIPEVDAMFKAYATTTTDKKQAEILANMAETITQPGFLAQFQASSPGLHTLLRDTCSLTRMGGSNKINVVPPEAWAEVDCRMLPDRPVKEFIADFKNLVKDTGVKVETIMAFSAAVSSQETPLYKAIDKVMTERHPGSLTVPFIVGGFTDSHFTRDLGIASYGFFPAIISAEEEKRVHGNDERISIEAFKQGTDDLWAIISEVVYN